MGIKERKVRDKEVMHDLILQSAHQLFIDRGFEEVSIRNIAEVIEYSPATIYLYFKDKNEIFHAIHGVAFKMFNEFMADAISAKDPFKQLVKMGELYIKFAFKYPKYYTIMFISEAPMLCDKTCDGWAEGETALRTLEGVIKNCIGAGYFKKQQPRELAFSIWSYMHGMVSLVLRNRMKHYPDEDHEAILEKSYKIFIQMLTKL